VQGTIALVVVALGLLVGFIGTQRSERAYVGDPDVRGRMQARLGKLRLSILVIALAVGFYLVARSQGHGLLGLRVCGGLLVANAFAVAALKIAAGNEVLRGDVAVRFKRFVLVEAVGFALLFAGVYMYLTR
jgi:hypothetical protein